MGKTMSIANKRMAALEVTRLLLADIFSGTVYLRDATIEILMPGSGSFPIRVNGHTLEGKRFKACLPFHIDEVFSSTDKWRSVSVKVLFPAHKHEDTHRLYASHQAYLCKIAVYQQKFRIQSNGQDWPENIYDWMKN